MKQNNTPIAIIGMACFFPKSSGTKEYWRLLFHGEDAITEVPETHWSPEDYFDADPKTPDHVYCKRGGFLSAVSFDPSEFGIPPNTLEATDTSQLLGLVAAKAALEDAGYGQDRKFDRNRASVILGVTGTQELVIPLGARLGHPKWRKALKDAGVSPELAEKVIAGISDSYVSWQENSFPGLLGNVVAGRICNRLDLGGTNCVVDAACASSMSAVHLALMELNTDRSDIVITGGVDALNDIFMHTCFSRTLILSPTGDVRPFSKDADGTVLGEGIGMVVLKRLADAEKDGDKIYAVIKGLGSSSDGKSQSIYSPSAEGQARALRKAYEIADVDPETVELIEAHGTGTRVGDATEFQALRDVFGNQAEGETAENRLKRCGIGSVKSMIGHTKAAAGAAGLIKVALSLYHKVFPPTLKVNEPDPNLKLDESPFYLSTESRPWFSRDLHPRRAGVSAFGFGGSNFHVVLEEYEKNKKEVAWDASVPRPEPAEKKSEKPVGLKSDIAFIFPGQGSQYVNMARDLICTFPEAFEVLEKANKAWHLQKSRQISDLTDFIYPCPALTKEEKEIQENALRSTDIAQPAIGAVSVAMLKILERFGIKAGAACGHSYGELTALYTAGWIDLDTFFRLSIARGHFMASAAGKNSGTMLAVKAPLEDIDALIKEANLDVILANRNSPNQGVLSGSVEAIAHAEKTLKQKKIKGIKLPVAAAFHSSLVKDAQEPFMDFLNKEVITPSEMPVFSNSTGKAYPAESDQAKQILGGQILCPVNFIGEIESMFESGVRTFIEIGPKSVLTGLVKAILKGREFEALALDSSSGKKFGVADLANMLSQLESLGYAVDWDKWDPPPPLKKQRMSIPISGANYRSERKSETKPVKSDAPEIKTDSSPEVQATSVSVAAPEKKRSFDKLNCRGGERSRTDDKINCRSAEGGRLQASTRSQPNGALAQGSARPVTALGGEISGPGNPIESRKAMNRNEQITSFDMNRGSSFPRKIKTDRHSGSACLFTDAFKAVQEGLKSMQSLQMQTADTHKKFLETQTEASRTLQMMMENTQRLAEISMGFGVPASNFRQTEERIQETGNTERVVGANNYSPFRSQVANDEQPASYEPKVKSQEPRAKSYEPAPSNLEPLTPNPTPIETALIEVVSHLTGYPTEMISPDMDIESDLGIDSIKRVEILSTLEERMPGLPSVSPEMMGSLRTLRQIVEFLGANGNRSQVAGYRAQGASNLEPRTPNPEPIESTLIEVVSHLTGYPTEMISPDMDIESDLGIDSIKRVEILSTLEERMPGLPSVSPEMMGSLRTLRQIAEYLGGNGDRSQVAGDREMQKCNFCTPAQVPNPALPSRNIVVAVESQFEPGERVNLPSGRQIVITDDGTGLGQAMADELVSLGIEVMLVSPNALRDQHDMPHIAGLIILSSREAGFDAQVASLKTAFAWTHQFAQDMLDAAKQGGAVFATVSRLDGAFGFKGLCLENPVQGGLAGLVKTASVEWENVCCHAIDIAPDWKDNAAIAKAAVAEMLHRGPVEIGLSQSSRLTFALESSPYPEGKIQLVQGDVVVISGGARGVTAVAAHTLASEVKPVLVLVGRSSAPTPEPEWLASAEDESEIKKAILANEFTGNHVSPKQLEKTFRAYMANREISRNIEKLKATGATILYESLDVRDADAVKSMLDKIRSAYGSVKAVIHGAGTLEDRLMIDKTPEQFEKVFDTKVMGLKSLLDAAGSDDLKYLVLFSSVAARAGNKGQSDYAAANEVLNKIAQAESASRPNCRVISINWGPWDGGMVSPLLKREFERKGIQLIPVEAGALAMLQEMKGGKSCPAEVVIGTELSANGQKTKNKKQRTSPNGEKTNNKEQRTNPNGQKTKNKEQITTKSQEPRANNQEPQKLFLTFKRELDVANYPILGSHVLGGKPVVPFALITEWLGHGALHGNPGLFLHGLDDIQLLSGIKLDDEKKLIRLMAGKARKSGDVYEVDVEIRNGVKYNREVIHSKAKAILTDRPATAPAFEMPPDMVSQAYPRSIEEAYNKILFHGIELQGIRKIVSCSHRGMVAEVSAAPSPEKWMAQPLRSRWIADPLVLDSAFQMAILWCFEEKGLVCLPSYSAAFRQYCDRFPSQGVTAVLEVTETTPHKMKGNFTFLDAEKAMLAQITGYEAVMDDSLFEAFGNKG